MGDPVTQAQFFEAHQQLIDRIDLKHTSMRQYVGERADKIEAVIVDHAEEDDARFQSITDRLLIIETERLGEKTQAVKRAGLLGLLVAFITTGFWKLVEHFSK